METPRLYRQLMTQLSQWVHAKEVRHLQGVCEAVGAILQSQQAAPARWLPYLSHRRCGARAHLERLRYLLENPHISAERFYQPLLQRVLAAVAHTTVTLALDTSVLWNQYCLVEVSLIWGGRSLTIAQTVLEHPSASVAFEDYRAVLEPAATQLPVGCEAGLIHCKRRKIFSTWLASSRRAAVTDLNPFSRSKLIVIERNSEALSKAFGLRP